MQKCGVPQCPEHWGFWDRGYVSRPDGSVLRNPSGKRPKTGPWWWPFKLFKAA